MKKFVILFSFILTAFSLSSVYAADASITTYDAEHGNVKTEFFIDETPWVNMILPRSDGTWNNTTLWTTTPSGDYYMYSGYVVNQDTWFDLDHITFTLMGGAPTDWQTIKTEGLWGLQADYSYPGASAITKTTTFTIIPEPISSALFLLGGAALFARRRKTQPKTPPSLH